MMNFQWKKKTVYFAGIIILTLCLGVSLLVYALDTSVNLPPASINTISTSQSSCGYYFMDVYDGTVMPGNSSSHAAPTGTNISLNFYNNVWDSGQGAAVSNPTQYTRPLTCGGTFEVLYRIDLKANSDVPSIVVTPLIQDSTGNTIYPASGAAATTTIYPECNNAAFTGTPYCTVTSISGAVQVPLQTGNYLTAPTIQTTSGVTVVGGSFEIIYLHP